jgi:hypothetical protein
MTDYRAELASQMNPATVADRVKRTQAIYAQLRPWIDKYRGGMPASFAAASIQWESDGKATTVGDPSLGEYGYFQVTAEFPTTIGLPSSARMDPETNVFLGLMDYQIAAVQMFVLNPAIPLGSDDSWKLARLSFSIGAGGTKNLLALAKPRSYADLIRYVDTHGAPSAGSQPPDQVWYRVHIVDLVWQIAKKSGIGGLLGGAGMPRAVPAPPAGAYQIPRAYLAYFNKTSPVLIVGIAAVGALAIWRWRHA